MVDGSANGRPEGPANRIVVCDDGRHALFSTGRQDRSTRVWGCSLDDGALALLTEGAPWGTAVVAHRARRVFALTGGGATLVWRDLDTGAAGALDVGAGSSLWSARPTAASSAWAATTRRGTGSSRRA